MEKAKLIDTFEPTKTQVRDLRNGLNEPFWQVLKALLEDEKKDTEKCLFDEDGVLTSEQREDYRQRRNILQYIIELPELVIEKSKPRKEPKTEDDETY